MFKMIKYMEDELGTQNMNKNEWKYLEKIK